MSMETFFLSYLQILSSQINHENISTCQQLDWGNVLDEKIDIKFGLFLKPKINPLTPFLIKRRKMTIWVGALNFSQEDVKHRISG